MKAIRSISAAAVLACMAFTACSDYVGKEESHALYVKYKNEKESRHYKEAADNLEEFLTICPKSPKAHYDAAMLYMENLSNYPFAIYHFNKYLELSGETISKDDIAAIQKHIQACKDKMSAPGLIGQQNNSAQLAEQKSEIDSLKANVTLLERKLSAQKTENNAFRKKISELSTYIDSQAQDKQPAATPSAAAPRSTSTGAPSATAPRSTSTGTPSATAPRSTSTGTPSAPRSTAATNTPSAPGTATSQIPKFDDPGKIVEGKDGVRYYYPASGDGWDKISRKMYGNVSMSKLLKEANAGISAPQIGRLLVIPPQPRD
jgi:tetratricopeptide (TPR) repeat protein